MQAGGQDVIPGTLSVTQAPQIPDHDLLHQIGRGAYGEVWLARNAVGTLRAVKIVQRSSFQRAEHFEREFKGLLKFEPLSRSHDGLVDILQIGRRDDVGYFYYVMELADAGDPQASVQCSVISNQSPLLTDNCSLITSYAPRTLRSELEAHGHLPPAECIAVGLKLAAALEHLHTSGLVHRDIKPSNIIFVNGEPKLADIGLVTAIDEARSLVGTAGYIPPEGPGSPQADLYSLGKVLYEMAFGKDRQEFPQLPPDLQSHPNYAALLELNEIILKACESDPRLRYASAAALNKDLALLQRGQSVRQHRKFQERIHVARRIGSAAAVVVLFASGVVFLWQALSRNGPIVGVPLSEDGTTGTHSPQAAKAYRLGLRPLRRGTSEAFRQAAENFNEAIEADPKFVAAYARLFEAYLMSEDHSVPFIDGKSEKLKELSTKLMNLAPTNAEAHAALAIVHFLNEWKWAEAESEFNRALELDPKCRLALTYYGYFLTRQRRADKARAILDRALALDLDSPLITKILGHCEFIERHYEKALPFYQQASILEPNYPSGHYWAGRVYFALTNYPQALVEMEQHELKQGLDPSWTKDRHEEYRNALKNAGPQGYWTNRIEAIEEEKSRMMTALLSYAVAMRYARASDKQQALDWLKRAFTEHDSMENLLVDEVWDEYHNEPSFKDILKKAGLDPWQR